MNIMQQKNRRHYLFYTSSHQKHQHCWVSKYQNCENNLLQTSEMENVLPPSFRAILSSTLCVKYTRCQEFILRNVGHWSPVGHHTLAGHSLSIGPILNITTALASFCTCQYHIIIHLVSCSICSLVLFF